MGRIMTNGRAVIDCTEAQTQHEQQFKEERADLECRIGTANKEYHVQLVQSESGWSCLAQGGGIGKALINYDKCHGVSYEKAKQQYDRVVKEKLTKNPPYKLVASTDAPPTPTVGGRIVNREITFSPELLTRVTEQEAIGFARQGRYWFQPKRDDRRLVGVIDGNDAYGLNKKGETIKIDKALAVAMAQLWKGQKITALKLDGEIEKSGFHVWDLLELAAEGVPLGQMQDAPYRQRYNCLQQMLASAPQSVRDLIHLVPVADTLEAKIAMLQEARDKGWEGIVIKDATAAYRPGRNGSHKKFKFEDSGTVVVGTKERPNDGHRSVGMWAYNGSGKLRYLGSVGVPDKYDLPTPGQFIDVRYLYLHNGPEGRLVQAKYFGVVRNDVRAQECNVQQFRLKQEGL